MENAQAPGTLPGGTITNPRDNHTVNVVVTRRGKSTKNVETKEVPDEGVIKGDLEIQDDLK